MTAGIFQIPPTYGIDDTSLGGLPLDHRCQTSLLSDTGPGTEEMHYNYITFERVAMTCLATPQEKT